MCSGVTDSSAEPGFKAETGMGHLSAFGTADPVFVQRDKQDRASPRKLFSLRAPFLRFPTQAADPEHDPVPRHTGEIWGVSQHEWVTAHTVTGIGDTGPAVPGAEPFGW